MSTCVHRQQQEIGQHRVLLAVVLHETRGAHYRQDTATIVSLQHPQPTVNDTYMAYGEWVQFIHALLSRCMESLL
jgi:hypothetical protein